jgi:hypothetical protein
MRKEKMQKAVLEYRKEHALSQRHFGDIVGGPHGGEGVAHSLRAWFNGRHRNIRIELAVDIAELIDFDLNELKDPR